MLFFWGKFVFFQRITITGGVGTLGLLRGMPLAWSRGVLVFVESLLTPTQILYKKK